MDMVEKRRPRRRWSDNDRHFGPLTYSRDSKYRPIAVILSSGDDDDSIGCNLRMSAIGRTFIVELPAIIKAAASMTTADLSLARMGISAGLGGQPGMASSPGGQVAWAKDRLKQLVGLSKIEKEMRKRQAYVSDLDPQIASLRSVALHHRVRMSRDISFERSEEREKSYLQGVIEGWWS